MTVASALAFARSQLTGVSDAPDLDAAWLLLASLQQHETSWLFTHSEAQLTPQQAQHFRRAVDKRADGTPLAYLLGWWEFYGRRFTVTPDVLIPRPSTEALIDAAVAAAHQLHRHRHQPLILADVGTGSGCIAITLALELSPTVVHKLYATDISPQALLCARQNARAHGVEDRLKFVAGDMLEPVQTQQLDLIVSNPPYVPSAELSYAKKSPTTTTTGLLFEPQRALNGGTSGRQYVQQLSSTPIPALIESTNGVIVRHLV